MSLVAKCSCGKTLQVKPELAGKRVRCPACQGVVVIPNLSATAVDDDPLGLGDMLTGAGSSLPMAPPGYMSYPAHRGFAAPGTPSGMAPRRQTGVSLKIWVAVGAAGAVGLVLVAIVAGFFLFRSRPSLPADNGPLATAAPAPDTVPEGTWNASVDSPRHPVSWPEQLHLNIP